MIPVFSTKTIEELTETLIDYRGKTPKKTDAGVKLITAKVIKDGFILDGNHEYIAEENYDDWMRRGLPKQWDILITTEAPLGEVAQLRTPEKVALAQRVILLRGKPDEIDQQYYFQTFKSAFVQAELKARATGTTVAGIKQSELRQVRIPYYPLPTQQNIASILSAYDDLIENNTRRIKILEEMAQAIYRHWFVDFKFPGHKKAKFINSKLGKIPEGWQVIELGEKIDFTRGKNITKKDIISGNVPVVAAGVSPAYYHNQSNIKSPVVTISSSGANAGFIRLYYEDIWASDCSYINKDSTETIFYFYSFLRNRQVEITALQRGSAQPHVYPKDLMKMLIVDAPEKLIIQFEEISKTFFNEVGNLFFKNQNLRRTLDLLLPKLISGEVDVSKLEIESLS